MPLAAVRRAAALTASPRLATTHRTEANYRLLAKSRAEVADTSARQATMLNTTKDTEC
jgi:hypothetical protein